MQTNVITGISSYVPARKITNQDWENLIDTSAEWIEKNTGIRERSRAGLEETTVDMAEKSSRQSLEKAGLIPADLDFIICGTNSQEYLYPSTASQIQEKLEASNASSLDVQSGCPGWLYGMRLAVSLVKSGEADAILVVGSDALSRFINFYDRSGIIFGDGAGSALVCSETKQKNKQPERLKSPIFHTGTVPSLCMQQPTIYREELNRMEDYILKKDMTTVERPKPFMDGKMALKLALTRTMEAAENVIEKAKAMGIEKDDIKIFIPHQTNVHIMQAFCDKLGYSFADLPLIVDTHGGISTACLPTAMSKHAGEGKIQTGDLVLACTYGAGFSYGAMLFEWT